MKKGVSTMNKEERDRETRHLKSEANTPKHRLMEIVDELYENRNSKEAKRLERIIGYLEHWQNT